MNGFGRQQASPTSLPQQSFINSSKLLIRCVTTPPTEPFHHVVFSTSNKDRVKFTKSKPRGHPARYWFELVSKKAVRFLNHYLDYPDFLGIKQLHQKNPKFGGYLATAPTRGSRFFTIYHKTVGSAWLS